MAATVLVRDALWRVSDLLQDTTPQFQRAPERGLVRWLNDGAAIIAKFLPSACSRIDSVKLKAGNQQSIAVIAAADCLPGDGSSPSVPIYGTQVLNLLCNMGANGLTPGDAIRVLDRRLQDTQVRDWHTRTGLIVRGYLSDPLTPRYFHITPGVPAGGSVWVRMSYTARPLQVPAGGAPGSAVYGYEGASTAVIPIDDEYLDDLVNYVVARENMRETEWSDADKATYFEGLFVQSINAKVTTLTGANPNLKRLPLATAPVGAAS